MALNLLKLVLSATSTSTTTLSPSQNGYYYTVTGAAATTSTTFAIANTSFLNNAGATVTQAFPTVSSDGYYTVSINGIQQMTGVSNLGTTALTLTFASAETFSANDIVDLQIVDYTPATQTATSVE